MEKLMKKKGFILEEDEFGTDLKEPRDFFDNGDMGTPLYFVKKV